MRFLMKPIKPAKKQDLEQADEPSALRLKKEQQIWVGMPK